MNQEHIPFSNMKCDYEHCFLCGTPLTKENSSDEHVIPTWLQNKHDLWNQKLRLINQTYIPYRYLKIPCCQLCNNTYLSEIENKIKNASVSFEEFNKLDRKSIFIWLLKIYYGLLFKDMSLIADRKNPNSGTIVSKEMLKNYKMVHEFLQSVRINMNFHREPFSLFIFKIHLSPNEDSKFDFHYTDDQQRTQLAIQIGEIGIILCIGDDGIVAELLSEEIKPYLQHTLHPIQFAELIALVFYSRARLITPPSYILINGKGNSEIISQLNSFTGEYFTEFSVRQFAIFFAHQLQKFRISFDDIYQEELDSVASYLTDQDGEPYLLDKFGVPFKEKNRQN